MNQILDPGWIFSVISLLSYYSFLDIDVVEVRVCVQCTFIYFPLCSMLHIHQLLNEGDRKETSQELRMLSSVTLDCQVTKIVMNSGSQFSEL